MRDAGATGGNTLPSEASRVTPKPLSALLDRATLGRLGGPSSRNDHPDHHLVTRYTQNRDSGNWAIFVGKIIMSPPSPLSARCAANEVTVAMEAGPEAESFVNANGLDWSKSSAAVECLRPARSMGRVWLKRAAARTTLNEGRRSDRRKHVA
jgi:hypothetical protein